MLLVESVVERMWRARPFRGCFYRRQQRQRRLSIRLIRGVFEPLPSRRRHDHKSPRAQRAQRSSKRICLEIFAPFASLSEAGGEMTATGEEGQEYGGRNIRGCVFFCPHVSAKSPVAEGRGAAKQRNSIRVARGIRG